MNINLRGKKINIVSYILAVNRKKKNLLYFLCFAGLPRRYFCVSQLSALTWEQARFSVPVYVFGFLTCLAARCKYNFSSHILITQKPVLSMPHIASVRLCSKRLIPMQRDWGGRSPPMPPMCTLCGQLYILIYMCMRMYINRVCVRACPCWGYVLSLDVGWTWGAWGCSSPPSARLLASAAPCQYFIVYILKALTEELHSYLGGETVILWSEPLKIHQLSFPEQILFIFFFTELPQPFQYAL